MHPENIRIMAFGLFKKKKKETAKDNRYFNLKVREIREVAKDAVNLVFDHPGGNFKYEAGQFITLIENVNGKKVRRAYSLCTSPFVDEHPAVTVKRVKDGIMSNHLNETLKPGDEIEAMEPMGMFTTTIAEGNTRKAVFIGGGSGITPLFSLIKSILAKEENSELILVYANRSSDYIIFKEELEKLQDSHKNFKLYHVLESNSENVADFVGIPTTEMVGNILDSIGATGDHEFYVCGPQPMMDIVIEGSKKYGIPEENIRYESFEAGKTSPSDIVLESSEGSEHTTEATIILDGEPYSITINREKGILEQALEQGLDMPYSCQSGLCTACRGNCLEGEVSVDAAEGLTQSELDEGYVLTCVGKAMSNTVRIEIG